MSLKSSIFWYNCRGRSALVCTNKNMNQLLCEDVQRWLVNLSLPSSTFAIAPPLLFCTSWLLQVSHLWLHHPINHLSNRTFASYLTPLYSCPGSFLWPPLPSEVLPEALKLIREQASVSLNWQNHLSFSSKSSFAFASRYSTVLFAESTVYLTIMNALRQCACASAY